ncbi:MAG: hypothetical protein J5794_02500 [Lachnospiraceae bacterium]|nr:hypothetical protein [Lachnospiraceae bacterium]
MSRFIPITMHPDYMPVDISFVFKNEKPAGKHGFAKVDGENIRFEDGTLARFWGVMFNGAACFPSHTKAEQVARRLAQTGINIVRFHQMDDEWTAPNLYRLTAGERVKNTRELCEECLERLDYLVKCLKDQGIYITVDMTTYRRFKPGDGVPDAHLLHDGTRLYAMYDPKMIELQKEFCEKFWTHKNPYTGLENREDPVFVMCTIINENDTFIDHSSRRWYHLIPRYDEEFRDMFAAWLKEKGIEYDAYGCELFTKDQPMQEFRMELMKKYCEDMYAYLRSLGVKIPICGSNYHTCYGVVKAQENMDYQDAHSYFYDWHWGEQEKCCTHAHVTEAKTSPLAGQCCNRIHGKPFFMTEWDVPYPNSHRAEGALWYASMSCLQNWSGMTIHTYGYGHDMSSTDLLGKIASTDTIGGVPYREGIFAIWNDPAIYGLFYHAALMIRRQDVQAAKEVIGAYAPADYYGKRANALQGTAMEIHQVHTVFDSTDRTGLKEVVDPKTPFVRENPNEIISDTGEVKRFPNKGVSIIDTPRTKALSGKIGSLAVNKNDKNASYAMEHVSINCKTDFATIAMSSLTDDPIEKTDNILLTAVGRARNHGAQFDGEKMIDPGTNPIEAEVIRASIEIDTDRENMEVWAIDSEGFYSGRVNSVYEDGKLKFTIGEEFACMYYLIVEP